MRCRTLSFVLLSASALMIAGCEQPSTSPKVDVTVWPGPVSPPPPPAVPKRITFTKYLAFGDSLTEGFLKGIQNGDVDPKTAGPMTGYPFKLLTLLSAKYTQQTMAVFDGGLAGRLAREDAEEDRLDFVLAQLPQKPEVMILMHGVNDLINGRSLASTIEHVQDLVDQAKVRGMAVLVSTLPPERDGGDGVGNALVSTFNNALKTQVFGATLIDVNPLVTPAMIGPDGLHLLESGNAALAAAYFARIAALYEFQPTATETVR